MGYTRSTTGDIFSRNVHPDDIREQFSRQGRQFVVLHLPGARRRGPSELTPTQSQRRQNEEKHPFVGQARIMRQLIGVRVGHD